jgi:hypothetical protein
MFEFIFLFLVWLDFVVEMPEIERGSLPINIAGLRIPEVPFKPKSSYCCADNLLRIADLED